jgi:hypothetical protein
LATLFKSYGGIKSIKSSLELMINCSLTLEACVASNGFSLGLVFTLFDFLSRPMPSLGSVKSSLSFPLQGERKTTAVPEATWKVKLFLNFFQPFLIKWYQNPGATPISGLPVSCEGNGDLDHSVAIEFVEFGGIWEVAVY